MDLNFFFNRFLKLSKQTLSEKDHSMITLYARQLQEDLAFKLQAFHSGETTMLLDDFIQSTLNHGGKNEQNKN